MLEKFRTYNWRLLSLLIFAFLTNPISVSAQVHHANWREMVAVCEAVISEQSKTPFERFAPAKDFTAGMPRERDYAVYNSTRDLVAIARNAAGDWVSCYVREVDEDSSHWRALEERWVAEFDQNFPKVPYEWSLKRFVRSGRISFLGAVRCMDELVYQINSSDEQDLYFRISVTKEKSNYVWASTESRVKPINSQFGPRTQVLKSCSAAP